MARGKTSSFFARSEHLANVAIASADRKIRQEAEAAKKQAEEEREQRRHNGNVRRVAGRPGVVFA
jgi:F0F1-type ATP synthase membrane subunit b/b'